MFCGKGIFKYTNGEIAESEYRDNKKNGHGVYRYGCYNYNNNNYYNHYNNKTPIVIPTFISSSTTKKPTPPSPPTTIIIIIITTTTTTITTKGSGSVYEGNYVDDLKSGTGSFRSPYGGNCCCCVG